MANIRNETKELLAVIRECLEYDPESGVLTWKQRPRSHFNTDFAWKGCNSRYPGTEAGTEAAHRHTRYRFVGVQGIRIKSHRIAWELYYGRWPEECETIPMQHENKSRGSCTYNWYRHFQYLMREEAKRLRSPEPPEVPE